MKRVLYRLFQIEVLFKIFICKILFIFNHHDCDNLFLISERGNDARDNGFALYSYLINKHPEINVKYVITNDSPDFLKINKENVVIFNSFLHYKFFLYGKYLISTHIMGFSPNSSICMRLNSKHLLPIRGKTVFLQHGITKDYSRLFDYEYTHLNLFVCAAKKERDFIIDKNKYPNNIVQNIGFCRFDNLIDKSYGNNYILIMPTWRSWHTNMSERDFLKDEFYLSYNALLNDSKFISYIEKNNITVYFYLHHETQKYSYLFTSKSKNIFVCKKQDYDVQELLLICNVLITDYSSVFFDFAYMKKKIIYYHFDYARYRQTHTQGFFSYEMNGFGNICYTIKDILENIQSFNLDKLYLARITEFFPELDRNNCSRTYESIIDLE